MSEEKIKHKLTITDRQIIKITGILDVISFDEEMIVSETELGVMILKGINFHISKLDLNNGELEIDGELCSLLYEEKDSYSKSTGGIFSKIFK